MSCLIILKLPYVLDLVFIKSWYALDDHPRERATKIYDFVHDKGHDSRCEDIILHEGIPGNPEAF